MRRDRSAARGRAEGAAATTMPRFKLTIEYAGTRYSGWQIQNNARTIQGELVKAVRDGDRPRSLRGLRRRPHRRRRPRAGPGRASRRRHVAAAGDAAGAGSTTTLPADIHVRGVEVVSHRFHARHDAIARGYLYQIARRRTAFAKPFVWWVRDPLDVAPDARRRRRVRRHAGLRVVHRRRSRGEVDHRGHRRGDGRGSRRAGARARRRLALPVEDGAADGRRPRRRRHRRDRSTRDRPRADLALRSAGDAHRAGVRAVPRVRRPTATRCRRRPRRSRSTETRRCRPRPRPPPPASAAAAAHARRLRRPRPGRRGGRRALRRLLPPLRSLGAVRPRSRSPARVPLRAVAVAGRGAVPRPLRPGLGARARSCSSSATAGRCDRRPRSAWRGGSACPGRSPRSR